MVFWGNRRGAWQVRLAGDVVRVLGTSDAVMEVFR